MCKYTIDEIKEIVEKENIRYIRLQFTDMDGFLKNVEIPSYRLDDALNGDVMFDGSSVEGFVRSDEADMFLVPDLDTFLISSWEDTSYGKVARFICDVYQISHTDPSGKEPYPGDPRGILKRNLKEMEKLGYSKFNVGVEPEFFLFKIENGKPSLKFNDNGGYFDVSPIDSSEDCRRDIVLELQKIGFIIEAAHHEVSPGQHEIDFKFDSALEACDSVQTFKLVVKNVAKRHGLHATFMPKPIHGINGSGMHCNTSLMDMNGHNVFYDESTENKLSSTALKWIDGILDHARGFTLITNPIVNSYKRIVPGFEAPCYLGWSDSNRTTMIRIPAARGNKTRAEVRSVDVASNPYLACSVLLAAGLDGIKGNCEHYEPIRKNLFEQTKEERKALGIEALPANLCEAIECFKEDEIIKEAVGQIMSDKFIEAKSLEWDEYRTQVTEWEINKYLTKY